MKRKSVSPVGALHPILFFAGVYIVALFFSIFICSSIFYSLNPQVENEKMQAEKTMDLTATTTIVASLK
jgi:hypothetical protein